LAPEITDRSIGEYAEPVPLKEKEQNLPALAGREAMNIAGAPDP
jgi:hypothetical protein